MNTYWLDCIPQQAHGVFDIYYTKIQATSYAAYYLLFEIFFHRRGLIRQRVIYPPSFL